jgi:hypothetical protein
MVYWRSSVGNKNTRLFCSTKKKKAVEKLHVGQLEAGKKKSESLPNYRAKTLFSLFAVSIFWER